MALLLTVATGAWAQDPDPIDLTSSADGTVWTLSTMPEYDVELEVTYYTDEEVAEMEEAAFTEGVELTKTGKNEWTLAATPAFDVELEVEYETDLALNEVDDNTEKLDDWDGYEADVTLTRTLQTGGWNTFALPFNLSIPMGWTVKELSSSSFDGEELTLNFADATSIKAGKPYLVKVAQTNHLQGATFSGAIVSKTTVPTETAAVDFVPTLGKTLVSGPEGDKDNVKAVLFMATGNQLVNPTVVNDAEQQASYMKGFRAYFRLKGEAAVKARSFSLDFGDGTTGIQMIEDGRLKIENSTDAVYDLQGRKVQNTAKKGVYIVNGKKVVIK